MNWLSGERRRVLLCAALLCGVPGTWGLGQLAAASAAPPSQEKAVMQRDHPVIVSEFSQHDIQPDGNLEKSFWAGIRRVSFDQAAFTRHSYPQSETEVASRWTRHSLYLAFWCRYQSLNVFPEEDPHKERWGLWDRDVVESFIAPDPGRPSHYFEFEVAPNNQWIDLEIDLTKHPFNDAGWNSGFEHATRVDPVRHLWTSEWRIPAAALSRAGIVAGRDWRVNFYRADGTDPNRRAMSWGALPQNLPQNSFHQPQSFGVLRFAAAAVTAGTH